LPPKERATLFRDGIDVIVPRWPHGARPMLPPDKTHNYLNLIIG
jgi:hypothetical protein